jgi:hypothetical protein
MKLISIDVGLRNFAWCVMQRTASAEPQWLGPPWRGYSVEVQDWEVIDIVALNTSETVNLNDTDIATIVPWFIASLSAHSAALCPPGLELAMIEAQPTGHMLPGGKSISNIKTKVLSHLLQAFYVQHGIAVRFVSPACKLRDAKHLMEDAADYGNHKKAAVKLTMEALMALDGKWLTHFQHQKRKKDDLADAFLQGVCGDLAEKKKGVKRKRRNAVVLDLPVFED